MLTLFCIEYKVSDTNGVVRLYPGLIALGCIKYYQCIKNPDAAVYIHVHVLSFSVITCSSCC